VVLEESPVRELVKEPVPVPLEVFVPEIVGLEDVPYATPLAVTDAPPGDTTYPPVEAELVVMEVGGQLVVTVGRAMIGVRVVKEH
jgi:hypothetical protein